MEEKEGGQQRFRKMEKVCRKDGRTFKGIVRGGRTGRPDRRFVSSNPTGSRKTVPSHPLSFFFFSLFQYFFLLHPSFYGL